MSWLVFFDMFFSLKRKEKSVTKSLFTLKNPNKYHLNTKQIHRKSNKFSSNIFEKHLTNSIVYVII